MMRVWLLCLLLIASNAWAAKPDPNMDVLNQRLQALENDPQLASKAQYERLRARMAVTAYASAKSRDKEHALKLAQWRLQAAEQAAQAELLQDQSMQLDRERDSILVEASRRDADRARQEAERLRLENLAREEEAERLAEQAELDRVEREQITSTAQNASAEAEQARRLAKARERELELARKEAELAAELAMESPTPPVRRSGNSSIYTLDGRAFASGKSSLTSAARSQLKNLAQQIKAGAGMIRIEAHTDSQGADAANLSLSQQRAEAVRKELVLHGVPTSRMQAVGKGETSPVADNNSAAGRERNRRVEIIVN
jgi:outer membrane protein OmpA-like peptidoglycan-associated protein